MKALARISKAILMGTILASCLDPYSPPLSNTDINFLVIDGYINTSDNLATVKLTRAVKLSASSLYPQVSGATVTIEDSNGQSLPVPEISEGVYEINNAFNDILQYRLKVAVDDHNYFSDFISIEKTPKIDSINWEVEGDALELLVNSHSDETSPKYFVYNYEETYEYSSAFASSYKFTGGVPEYRAPEEEIFRCWKSRTSSSIVVTSTENLAENVVSEFPILKIAMGDRRLWKKYSMLLHQRAISKEAYNYWIQLKKTNESLGSLFDPIPYQIKGNVYSQSSTDEIVLGYFTAGELKSKRITISNGLLPNGFGGSAIGNCIENYITVANLGTLNPSSVIITTAVYEGPNIVGYNYSIPACVDCRLSGGSSVKPDFM